MRRASQSSQFNVSAPQLTIAPIKILLWGRRLSDCDVTFAQFTSPITDIFNMPLHVHRAAASETGSRKLWELGFDWIASHEEIVAGKPLTDLTFTG